MSVNSFRYILPCLLCVFMSFGRIGAQAVKNDELSRNVIVERDYVASKIDAEKVNPVPDPEDKPRSAPVQVDLETGSDPSEVWPAAGKAEAAAYELPEKGNAKDGIFKAGLGFYWQVDGDFYYPLLKGDKYLLDIKLRHSSNWGRVTLQDGSKPRAMDHITSGALNFESQFSSCRLVSSIDFNAGGFDYYGYSTVPAVQDAMKDTVGTFVSAGIDFKLFSTDVRNELQYDFGLGYTYNGRNFGVMQHDLDLSGDINGEVGDGRFGGKLDLDLHVFDIDNAAFAGVFPGANAKITLTPYYKWQGDNWDLSLGANLFVFGQKDAARPVAGSAEIRGNFGLVPGLFNLYAGISGDYSDNNYWDLLQENHFIRPDLNVSPTYTPLAVDLGIKVNIMDGLLFDLGFDYNLILDQYFYVNDTDGSGLYYNSFTTVTEPTAHKVSVNAGLYFNFVEGLDMKLTGKYNFWNTVENLHAWQKPAWEVDFDAKYRFLKKWQVGLQYGFMGGRYALVFSPDAVSGEAVKMQDVHDINVSVSYDALDWLTVFAEGDNLANIKADTYYGYTTFGINGKIGVSMYF